MDAFTVVVTVLCWAWICYYSIGGLLSIVSLLYTTNNAFDKPVALKTNILGTLMFVLVYGLLISPAIAILCLI